MSMFTPAALLDGVVKQLIREKGDVLVNTWFEDAEAIAIKDGVFVVQVTDTVKQETMTKRFTDNVIDIIEELSGERLRPLYLASEDEVARWRVENEDSIYASYTFERFIVGKCNKFAHAAAYAVAHNPEMSYNPLLIWGQSGLGKTHLLYAIGGEMRRRKRAARIVYIKGDDFTNELVSSIRLGMAEQFREKYRQADLLLVDDIQFIAGKPQTQEEFFHTFNTMHEAGKQIVLTSDRPPKEILTLEDRLRTRFEWGLLADIQAPDLETRMALVQAKADVLHFKIPHDVTEYIAAAIESNVRQIEGAVKTLYAQHTLMGLPLDLDLARNAIADIFVKNPGLRPTPDLILEEVSSYYGLSAERIRGTARTKDIMLPRQVVLYLIRQLTELSLPEIGRFIGQHHTTAMHSIEKIEQQLRKNPAMQNAIDDMTKNIKSR